jgi:alkaline phosphatase D
MKRRGFLRATLVTAGALLAPACGGDDDTGSSSSGTPPACEPTLGEAYFPQSIASGDPRPDTVILWTRVADPDATGDLEVELEVALDEAFTQPISLDGGARMKLTAEAAFDRCVKARLTGLSPATDYYYRFFYTRAGECLMSRTGRTRTAPAEDADVTVRFAYVSCQDFIGRYYNNHLALAREPLDFFVHLGDYVYETTGDPTFQEKAGDRKVVFTDTAGAISLGEGGSFYAARSLDNYRELYRTYRGDAALQAMHERVPMIAVWDDHEFSDDCHGATATYFDGREDETDEARRKAANQAWFKYMPVDYPGAPDFRYDPSAAYPNDLRIYRDFKFGKHVHLVMTDLRTYRADHLIPEEAFPGKVVLDEAALVAALGAVPPEARPYVDIETFAAGAYKPVVAGAAGTLGFDAANVTGKLSVAFVNSVVATLADPIGPIDDTDPTLELGIAYIDLGKNAFYSSLGSRYLVVKETFDILSGIQHAATSGASSTVMGAEQEDWFLATLSGSTSTWKIWGNEYCVLPLQIDVSSFPIPDALKHRFYMNCDAWDGFRESRSVLVEQLATIGNVVVITGDIHAFYAGTPASNGDPSKKIVELVGASLSSATYKSLLQKQVAADPVLSTIPLAGQLAGAIDTLFLATDGKVNPHLGYARSDATGFSVLEASGAELAVTFHVLPEKYVLEDYAGREDELLALYETVKFRTLNGEGELYQEIDGAWKRWDPDTMTWV